MLIAVAVVVGTVFLWELLSGIGIVGWGLLELGRQALERDRLR